MPYALRRFDIAFAGNRENDRLIGPIKVNKDGEIPMSLAGFGFIGTEGLQTAEIQAVHGGLHIMQHDTPESFVIHCQKPGCGQGRHFPDQEHGGLLKEQGETAAFARPRDQDLLDLMFRAANTWNRGGNDTVALKEIEMSPAHLLEIMGVAEFPAYWTREKRTAPGSSREAKFVRTFGCIEQLPGNLPRRLQPQT